MPMFLSDIERMGIKEACPEEEDKDASAEDCHMCQVVYVEDNRLSLDKSSGKE